jgi:hypothetical protein
MKKILYLAAIAALFLSSCKDEKTPAKFEDVTVSMGANLVYDVFYSFENGPVKVVRSDWDIAFSVPLQTASIRINEGSGVELFTAGAAAAWDSLSINPSDPNLKKLWNDKSNWLNGAFNRNADTTQPFNYGWGTYDHAITYNVLGDSVFVVKLTTGTFKKFFIEMRDGHANIYFLKWANLDGSEPDSASIEMGQYASKQFVYFSIVNNEVVAYEPDKDTWDILFTAYKEKVPMGPGVYMDYDVMGVLANQGYTIAKVSGAKPDNACSCDAPDGFVDKANTIGWDWKISDHAGGYAIPDTLNYFVKTPSDTEYQLYFTAYGGMASGDISFKVKK